MEQILYTNGARKFALIGVGAIGCSPNELAQNSRDGTTCDERINSANRIFNSKLINIVDQFNQNTPDAKFTYINAYGIFQDIITNPARYGNRSVFITMIKVKIFFMIIYLKVLILVSKL